MCFICFYCCKYYNCCYFYCYKSRSCCSFIVANLIILLQFPGQSSSTYLSHRLGNRKKKNIKQRHFPFHFHNSRTHVPKMDTHLYPPTVNSAAFHKLLYGIFSDATTTKTDTIRSTDHFLLSSHTINAYTLYGLTKTL